MKFVTRFALIFAACAAAWGQTPTFNTGQSARLVIGQPQFDAESDSAGQNIVGAMSGLAFANNTLFVADGNLVGAAPNNNRVLIFGNMSQQLPPPNAAFQYNTQCPVCVGNASNVLGQSNWTNDLPAPCITPPATVTQTQTPTTPTCLATSPQTPIATGMNTPTAVASDGTHLAVADTLNNRVLLWNSIPTAMNQPPDVVLGQANFTTNTFPGDTPTASSLRGPQGVWIQDGKLFIADTQNDRVLIFNSIPTTNGAAADIVLGQPNMTTWIQVNIADQNTNAAANNMLTPVSVTSDGKHLFVSDLGYNRVLIWNEIPTTNDYPADVEIGQPNMTEGVPDNAFTTTTLSPAPSTGVDTQEQAVLCTVSNGVDANNNATYPPLCAYTLSFPRYAISDGTSLYVADGGNDRVLIYTPIPTANAAAASLVLGQTDFVTDAPTDGADTMDAPLSIAWDSTDQNLYVADTYNQRILVYTKSVQNLPYNSVLNSASLIIYAVDYVTLSGTVKAGNTVTITIGNSDTSATEPYTYTIQSGDDFESVVDGLVALINAGKGDPNVIATADIKSDEVVLTARVSGANGNNVTVATSISGGAEITAIAANGNLTGGGSAASVAPGTVVSFLGTNLSDQTCSAKPNTTSLTLCGVSVYFNGISAPLFYVSSTQINAQVPFNFGFIDTGTATAWVRIENNGAATVSNSVAISIVPANPGIFANPGPAPRVAQAYHSSSYATGVVSVDGTIKAGDVGTICIGSNGTFTAGTTVPTGCSGGRMYNYFVQPGDSLNSIQQAFVKMLADDPQVSATASSEFTRILLQARVPGTAGNGIPFQAIESSGADLVMTAIGPTAVSPASGETLCCASATGAGSLITPTNPALAGETIIVYATGLGLPAVTPQGYADLVSGQPYAGPAANTPANFVSSEVNGTTANVLRAELVPGLIGIYQVYLQLDAATTTAGAAQLYIAQNDFLSNIVTIPVYNQPTLSSIACSPDTASAGTSVTCTVTMTVAAPTGTITVDLSSSDTVYFPVPSSIAIPAGTISNSFTVTVGSIGVTETVTLTATLGTVSTTGTISISP